MDLMEVQSSEAPNQENQHPVKRLIRFTKNSMTQSGSELVGLTKITRNLGSSRKKKNPSEALINSTHIIRTSKIPALSNLGQNNTHNQNSKHSLKHQITQVKLKEASIHVRTSKTIKKLNGLRFFTSTIAN